MTIHDLDDYQWGSPADRPPPSVRPNLTMLERGYPLVRLDHPTEDRVVATAEPVLDENHQWVMEAGGESAHLCRYALGLLAARLRTLIQKGLKL